MAWGSVWMVIGFERFLLSFFYWDIYHVRYFISIVHKIEQNKKRHFSIEFQDGIPIFIKIRTSDWYWFEWQVVASKSLFLHKTELHFHCF